LIENKFHIVVKNLSRVKGGEIWIWFEFQFWPESNFLLGPSLHFVNNTSACKVKGCFETLLHLTLYI
jgi:hypothetical protein